MSKISISSITKVWLILPLGGLVWVADNHKSLSNISFGVLLTK